MLEGVAIEDRGSNPVDYDSEQAQHSEDFVHRALADEPFLEHVAEAIERCANEAEKVAFELGRRVTSIGACDVVGRKQDSHSSTADQDTGDLRPFVADAQEEERYDHDADDGPKVQQLSGEDVGVVVREDGEVVSFDVEEGKAYVFPAVDAEQHEVALEAIFVN